MLTRERYKEQIAQADAKVKAGRDRDYWLGFRRGLGRAHYGSDYGAQDAHDTLMAQPQDGSELSDFATGYRAALAPEMAAAA